MVSRPRYDKDLLLMPSLPMNITRCLDRAYDNDLLLMPSLLPLPLLFVNACSLFPSLAQRDAIPLGLVACAVRHPPAKTRHGPPEVSRSISVVYVGLYYLRSTKKSVSSSGIRTYLVPQLFEAVRKVKSGDRNIAGQREGGAWRSFQFQVHRWRQRSRYMPT